MSDKEDNELEQAAEDLAAGYATLQAMCAHMPVAIALPRGVVTPSDCATALTRAVDVLKEEPLPEEIRIAAQTACIGWLNALDLFQFQVAQPRAYRLAGVSLSLLTSGDALIKVMDWLITQK